MQTVDGALGQRRIPRVVVIPGEQLARIPKPLRRVLHNEACRKRDFSPNGFNDRLELAELDLLLLGRSEVDGMTRLDGGMTFAVASLPDGASIDIFDAAIERIDLILPGEFSFFPHRP